MLKKLSKLLLLAGIGLLFTNKVYSAAFTSTTSGNWSNPATWGVASGSPGYGDTATIATGTTVYIDVSTSVGTNVAANNAISIQGKLQVPYDLGFASLTCYGNIQVLDGYTPGATFQIGYASNPYLATSSFTVRFNCDTADEKFGMFIHQGTNPPRLYLYGNDLYHRINTSSTTYWARTVSPVTTSSNSVVIDRQMFASGQNKVGHRILITGTGAATQAEMMTISTYSIVNSSITFTSNFTNAHSSNCFVISATRNIIFENSNTTYRSYFYNETNAGTPTRNSTVYIDNVEFDYMGGDGYQFWIAPMGIPGQAVIKNIITDNYKRSANNYSSAIQYTDCVWSRMASVCHNNGGTNNTYTRCWFIPNSASRACATISGSGYTVFDDCYFLNGYSGIILGGVSTTLNNCKVGWNNGYDTIANAIPTPANTVINNLTRVGDYTTIIPFSGFYLQYHDITYNNCNFNTYTRSGFNNPIQENTVDSVLKIQKFNGDANDNRVYTGDNGWVYMDTVTYRTISPSLNFSPKANAAYSQRIIWKASCNKNDSIQFRGFGKINSTYGSATLPYVKLETLDGVINTTATFTTSTDWNQVLIGGVATDTTTVILTVYTQSLNSGATFWLDDARLYVNNSVNDPIKTWVNGYPSLNQVASTIDPSNLFNTSTGTYQTAGTWGAEWAQKSQINTSSGTLASMINTSSGTLSGQIGAISIDNTPVLNAIASSSNTVVNELHISTGNTVNGTWNKIIYNNETASDTLKNIRKRIQ